MIKKILWLAIFVVLLNACSHKDATIWNKSDVNCLLEAARFCEKKLHVAEDLGGFVFSDCMDGKKTGQECKKLYKQMLIYMNSKCEKNCNATKLLNKKNWPSIKQTYENLRFDTV